MGGPAAGVPWVVLATLTLGHCQPGRERPAPARSAPARSPPEPRADGAGGVNSAPRRVRLDVWLARLESRERRLVAARFLTSLAREWLHAQGRQGPDVRRLQRRARPSLARLLAASDLTVTERLAALRLAYYLGDGALVPLLRRQRADAEVRGAPAALVAALGTTLERLDDQRGGAAGAAGAPPR